MLRVLVTGKKEFITTLSPLIKGCGITPVPSRSSAETLAFFRRDKCEIAIIQETLEDGTIDNLVTELKKIHPGLIVIAALNRRDADRALHLMEAGTYECLFEPVNPDYISTVLRGVVKMLSGTFLPEPSIFKKLVAHKPSLRTIGLAVSAVVLVVALAGVGFYFMKKSSAPASADLPLSFRLPYPNPTGIAWDGKGLWVSDWSTQTIYKHKIDPNLNLEKFYSLSDIPVISLAWSDGALWTVGQDGNIRKHLLDGRLTVVAVIRLQAETPSAIAWDGKNLWSCDAQARKIYHHNNDENLSVIATYDFPGKNPVGLVWMGRDLWVADEGTGTIYRLRFDGGLFTLQESLRLGVHLPGTNKLSGIAYDGRNFWTISEGNGLIFRHPLASVRSG